MYKSQSLSAEPKAQEGEALPRGRVNEVCQEWMVREDGALAYRLQAQEFDEHLSGNKFRNAVVREDFPKAKTEQMREQQLAEQTAMIYQRMLAEQEEHDKVVAKQLADELEREERMKRRALEVHDQDLARQLLERERSRVEQRHHAAALGGGYSSSSSSSPPPQRPPPPRTYENFPPPAPPPPPQRPEPYGYPQQQHDVRTKMMMMMTSEQLLQSQQSFSSSSSAAGPIRRQAKAMPLPFQLQKQAQLEGLEDLEDEHGDLYTEPYRNPDTLLLVSDFNRIELTDSHHRPSQTRKDLVPPPPPSELIATTPSPPPPLLSSSSLGNADDPDDLPSDLVDEHRLMTDRQLQEEKDAELARQLQAQEGSLEDTLIHRDRMLAIEAQDKELAKMLQERERTKARKARERAKAKALAKKQQQQQQQQQLHQQPHDLQQQPMAGGVGAGVASYSREPAHQQQQQHRLSSDQLPNNEIIMPDDSYSYPADLIPGAAASSLLSSRRNIPGISDVYSLPQEEDGNYSTPIDVLPQTSPAHFGEFYHHHHSNSSNNNSSGSQGGGGAGGLPPPPTGLFDYHSNGGGLSSPSRIRGDTGERFSNGSSASPITSSDNNLFNLSSNLIRPSTLLLLESDVGNVGGNNSRVGGDNLVPAVRPNQLDLRSPLTRPSKTRYHHSDHHPLEPSDTTGPTTTTTNTTCTTPTPTSTSGGGGGGPSSHSSPSHVNIAMAIDPTYPRNRGGGSAMSAGMHQSASSSFDTASSGTVTTSTSSSSPGIILPPPELSEVEDDAEGGGVAPPYMPIQGQRRNLSLEKKQKKSKNKEGGGGGGCKQQ